MLFAICAVESVQFVSLFFSQSHAAEVEPEVTLVTSHVEEVGI